MLDKELQKLGLSDKEAKVYLSSLELGPSPVQVIAQKAGINRATTYVMIESLIGRGLMSSFEKGKKRFFTAESPDQLMTLLKKEEAEVGTKIKQLGDMIPELKMIFSSADEKPKVKFFEGIEGLRVVQKDILDSKYENLEEIVSLDEFYKIITAEDDDHRKLFHKKIEQIVSRVIYTSKKGKILKSQESKIERRYIPADKFSLPTEIIIYGNKVAISVCKGKLVGFIIESKDISNSLRSVFDLVWEAVEKYQK